MKAKVIATGEIVDVECSGIDGMSVMFKEISSTSAKTFRQSQLDFGYNNPPTDKNIDWEQRRFELVKAALIGALANSEMLKAFNMIIDKDMSLHTPFVNLALATADMVIEKLKVNEP